MKTNYILLTFFLSFSFANAQDDNMEAKNVESNQEVYQINDEVSLYVNDSETVWTTKEDLAIETSLVRNSDIKIYLNHIRNVENIDLLFPKINKTVKA